MTNQPTDESRSEKYVGKFVRTQQANRPEAADSDGKRSRRRGLLALLILLLCTVRLGAEAVKGLSILDHYGNGRRMLIYGDVSNVDFGNSLKSIDGEKTIQVLDEAPSDSLSDDYIIRQDNGKTLIYHNHTYHLNEDLATILFLGIDKQFTEEENLPGTGGQSDVILLIGIDTKTGKSTVLNINRDTKAEVDEYTLSGNFNKTKLEQITLAYAYGDGHKTSCENTITSVSRLLYNLPISSYVALDMDGVDAANEAVGGVRVKSLVSYDRKDGTSLKEGEIIVLHGYDLNRYIRKRSQDVDANAPRMERQMQFMTEFTKAVVRESKKDLTFPVDLFSTLSPYMITDLELPDVTFLSSCFLKNGSNFSFRKIDGTYTKDKDGRSLYLIDEVDLFDAILQMFYIQVD